MMPNRILYERICVSATMAQLSAHEERFFTRLLTQCDDFGRFDARPAILRARCFPLQLESVTEMDIETWLARLIVVGLVRTYEAREQPFLVIVTWGNYQR